MLCGQSNQDLHLYSGSTGGYWACHGIRTLPVRHSQVSQMLRRFLQPVTGGFAQSHPFCTYLRHSYSEPKSQLQPLPTSTYSAKPRSRLNRYSAASCFSTASATGGCHGCSASQFQSSEPSGDSRSSASTIALTGS